MVSTLNRLSYYAAAGLAVVALIRGNYVLPDKTSAPAARSLMRPTAPHCTYVFDCTCVSVDVLVRSIGTSIKTLASVTTND